MHVYNVCVREQSPVTKPREIRKYRREAGFLVLQQGELSGEITGEHSIPFPICTKSLCRSLTLRPPVFPEGYKVLPSLVMRCSRSASFPLFLRVMNEFLHCTLNIVVRRARRANQTLAEAVNSGIDSPIRHCHTHATFIARRSSSSENSRRPWRTFVVILPQTLCR